MTKPKNVRTEEGLLWESQDPGASSFRLRCKLSSEGCLSLWLLRQTAVFRAGDAAPHQQQWWAASELIIYLPVAIDEVLRLSAHWCDFYDARLKASLPGLEAALLSRLASVDASQGAPAGAAVN